jgi:hypothetical protein
LPSQPNAACSPGYPLLCPVVSACLLPFNSSASPLQCDVCTVQTYLKPAPQMLPETPPVSTNPFPPRLVSRLVPEWRASKIIQSGLVPHPLKGGQRSVAPSVTLLACDTLTRPLLCQPQPPSTSPSIITSPKSYLFPSHHQFAGNLRTPPPILPPSLLILAAPPAWTTPFHLCLSLLACWPCNLSISIFQCGDDQD